MKDNINKSKGPPAATVATAPELIRRSNGFDVSYHDSSTDKRVGYLQIDNGSAPNSAVIKAIDVDEGFTRQGIATRLYEEARKELLNRGITAVKGSLEGSGTVQLREKVFGKGNTKYFQGVTELTPEEAIQVMDKDFGYVRAVSENKPCARRNF